MIAVPFKPANIAPSGGRVEPLPDRLPVGVSVFHPDRNGIDPQYAPNRAPVVAMAYHPRTVSAGVDNDRLVIVVAVVLDITVEGVNRFELLEEIQIRLRAVQLAEGVSGS